MSKDEKCHVVENTILEYQSKQQKFGKAQMKLSKPSSHNCGKIFIIWTIVHVYV